MLVTILNLIGTFFVSFLASMLAFTIWVHFHFEDFWAERKERLEAKRARKRYEKGKALDNDLGNR